MPSNVQSLKITLIKVFFRTSNHLFVVSSVNMSLVASCSEDLAIC